MRRVLGLLISVGLLLAACGGSRPDPAVPASSGDPAGGAEPGSPAAPSDSPVGIALVDPCLGAVDRLPLDSAAERIGALPSDPQSPDLPLLGLDGARAAATRLVASTFCGLTPSATVEAAIAEATARAVAGDRVAAREIIGDATRRVIRDSQGTAALVAGAEARPDPQASRDLTTLGAADKAVGGDGAAQAAAVSDMVHAHADRALPAADAEGAAQIAAEAQFIGDGELADRAIARLAAEVAANVAAAGDFDPCTVTEELVGHLIDNAIQAQLVGAAAASEAATEAIRQGAAALAARDARHVGGGCERWQIDMKFVEKYPGLAGRTGAFSGRWIGTFDVAAEGGPVNGSGKGLFSGFTACLEPKVGYVNPQDFSGALTFTVIGNKSDSTFILAVPTVIDFADPKCSADGRPALDRGEIMPVLRDPTLLFEGPIEIEARDGARRRLNFADIWTFEVWLTAVKPAE